MKIAQTKKKKEAAYFNVVVRECKQHSRVDGNYRRTRIEKARSIGRDKLGRVERDNG